MAPVVSVPEKTLEHWASQYLTYRYRSWAGLWWPARGEDIDVQRLPSLPGKAVQIELKTTTPAGKNKHEVKVDIGQLKDYLKSRAPVFYAFPRPEWKGELRSAALRAGIAATELAFSRTGPKWWFAEWMIVMTAKEVASVLSAKVSAHKGTTRGNHQPLVTFTVHPNKPSTAKWHSGRRAPTTYPWRDFWTKLEQCGDSGWPQVVQIQKSAASGQTHLSRSQVRAAMNSAAGKIQTGQKFQEALVTFESDGSEGFRRATPLDGDGAEIEETDNDEHRQVVFLDARAIQ